MWYTHGAVTITSECMLRIKPLWSTCNDDLHADVKEYNRNAHLIHHRPKTTIRASVGCCVVFSLIVLYSVDIIVVWIVSNSTVVRGTFTLTVRYGSPPCIL